MKAKKPHYNVRRLLNKTEGYLYILPTLLLMMILLVIPIFMVIQYSLYDNVIITDESLFVGLRNYITVLNDKVFIKAISNTARFTLISIGAHLVIGMIYALLLNSKYLSTATKGLFRVLYALP